MSDPLTAADLERYVAEADVDGLADRLLAANAVDVKTARAWYRAARSRVETYYRSEAWRRDHPWGDPLDKRAAGVGPVLATGLAGPASAARWIQWGSLIHLDDAADCRRFIEVGIARGPDWCAEFVVAAASMRLRARDTWAGAPAIYRCVTEMIVAHNLPVPDGAAYAQGWAASLDWRPSADDLVADAKRSRVYPDVFHHALAAGVLGLSQLVLVAPDAAAELVAVGLLDRGRLVDQVVGLLPVPTTPGTQRVLAGLIATLGMTGSELPSQWPALRGILTTAHRSVVAALLPFAVAALTSGDDLAELCTTLVGRPEKKQRRDLVAALRGPELQERLGAAAVTGALRTLYAAGDDDPVLAEKINAALAELDESAEARATPVPSGLWDVRPPAEQPYAANPLRTFAELSPGLLTWIAGEQGGADQRAVQEVNLAAVVGDAWLHGADRTWATLTPVLDAEIAYPPRLLHHLRDARPGGRGPGYGEAVELAGVVRSDTRTRQLAEPFELNYAPSSVGYLVASEALARLGRMPCLLSTASHDDLTVCFDELVARLHRSQGSCFGPADLFQTLLRLRPVEPSRRTALDGLTLPLDTALPHARRCEITDAVDAIRTWVGAGGLPDNEPLSPPGHWTRECRPPQLPIEPDAFGVIPPGALENLSVHRPIGLVPRWPDALGAALDQRFLGTEVPLSPYAYRQLVADLADGVDKVRDRACRVALSSIARGRLDPVALATAAVEQVAGGRTSVARLSRSGELLASSGGLREMWPALLELARHAVTMTPRPAGLADLLAVLARLAPEVPEPLLAAELTAFAQQRGRTQSHVRARELVAATGRHT